MLFISVFILQFFYVFVNWFWHFLHYISRFLIIFTITILNSFSGSLPISSSFMWTSVFLVCSLICAVFLCFYIIFLNLLHLRSPFPRLQGWILYYFAFCPPKSGPVLCKFHIGWDLCWVFFFFPLLCVGLGEVVILSADDLVCAFVLFVVWMRHPAQGATGNWVMLGLVFKWFPLWEFAIWFSLGLGVLW